jgi:hypothetical protein
MSAQHRQLMPYLRDVAVDDVAGVGQMGDRAQSHLFAAPAIITGGRGFCTGFGSRIASST